MKTLALVGVLMLGVNAAALWVIAWELPATNGRTLRVQVEPVEIERLPEVMAHVDPEYDALNPLVVEIEK